MKRVGFLATGSELTSGETLNSNTQQMSQILFKKGVNVGEHLLVDDQEKNIVECLNFLAKRHSCIILSGGLGPTSDDRTRFALSHFLNRPLIFNPESWARIEKRFELRQRTPTENNKIQSLFPETALVLPNPNGTADGCLLKTNDHLFFLLPGPPKECLPLFETQVLKILDKAGYFSTNRLYRWTLNEVSESIIADKLDPLAKKYGIEIAYRAVKPMLHIKVMAHPAKTSAHPWIQEIESMLAPYPFTREFPDENSPQSS